MSLQFDHDQLIGEVARVYWPGQVGHFLCSLSPLPIQLGRARHPTCLIDQKRERRSLTLIVGWMVERESVVATLNIVQLIKMTETKVKCQTCSTSPSNKEKEILQSRTANIDSSQSWAVRYAFSCCHQHLEQQLHPVHVFNYDYDLGYWRVVNCSVHKIVWMRLKSGGGGGGKFPRHDTTDSVCLRAPHACMLSSACRPTGQSHTSLMLHHHNTHHPHFHRPQSLAIQMLRRITKRKASRNLEKIRPDHCDRTQYRTMCMPCDGMRAHPFHTIKVNPVHSIIDGDVDSAGGG